MAAKVGMYEEEISETEKAEDEGHWWKSQGLSNMVPCRLISHLVFLDH